MKLDDIRRTIFAKRLPAKKEARMQEIIAERLDAAGIPYRREVKIGPKSRIDFEVDADEGRVGIECKTQSTATLATRQLSRYAETDRYVALVLLATMPYNIKKAILAHETPLHIWQSPTL